jgi:hypothetical protein
MTAQLKSETKYYPLFASAFAWVPALSLACLYLAALFDGPQRFVGGETTLAVFILSGLLLLASIVVLARSERKSRWIFVGLNCVPLVGGLWLFAIAMFFHA